MKIVGAVYYESNIFGLSVFNEMYIIIPYYVDNYACENLIRLIKYYRVKELLVSEDIDPRRIYAIERESLVVIRVPRRYYRTILFKETNVLGNKSFNALCVFNKHSTLSKSVDKNIIGKVNNIPIMLKYNNSIMYLSLDTLRNMKILDEKYRIKKEDVNCLTRLGEMRLHTYLQTPFLKISLINERRKFQGKLADYYLEIESALSGMKTKEFSEKLSIYEFKVFLKKVLKLAGRLEKVYRLPNYKEYKNLYKKLSIVKKTGLKKGFDHKYDKMKQEFMNLPRMLKKLSIMISKKMLIKVSVKYVPQIGFLLKGKELDIISEVAEKTETDFIRSDNSCSEILLKSFSHKATTVYKFIFALKNVFYYRTKDTYELDETIGDIKNKLKYVEYMYLEEMEDVIRKVNTNHLYDYLAEVDVMHSMGKMKLKGFYNYASLYEITKAEEETGFQYYFHSNWKVALCKNSIVVCDFNFLEKVGRFQLLTQMGAAIPVEKAKLPVVDLVLYISPKNDGSKFINELQEIEKMLSVHTRKTLVLLDHVFETTSTIEGLSLFLTLHDFIRKSFSITQTSTNYLEIEEKIDMKNIESGSTTFSLFTFYSFYCFYSVNCDGKYEEYLKLMNK